MHRKVWTVPYPLKANYKDSGAYDPISSNGSNTLLGCELVVHMEQVEEFWFEDVNGQKIIANLFRL